MRNAGPGEKDSPCVTHEKGEKKERGSQRRAGRGGGGGGGGEGLGLAEMGKASMAAQANDRRGTQEL